MAQVLTGTVARPPVGGTLVGHLEACVLEFARSLELTRPEERERAIHWLLLAITLVIAAFIRFWGLGSVGLHGDEETMAMAVRGIREYGAPLLPSGMFYPRGLTQLALMSISTSLFGESEWALRLPSALCGVVLVFVGYFAGRRFLRPSWSLALAISLALLPQLIIYSQTARMYIFLVTFIAAAMVCVFAWERTNKLRWLIGAIVALIFGLEMHSLAIASMLMLLFPGVMTGDVRKLGSGVLGMLAVSVGFVAIELFVSAQYPDPPSDLFGGTALPAGPTARPDLSLVTHVALGIAALAVAYFAFRILGERGVSRMAWLAAVLLLAAVGLQLMLCYHLAALCYIAGFVLAVRAGVPWTSKNLVAVIVGAALIGIWHAWLIAPQAGTLVRLVGAVNGQPSTWPYARLAEFSLGGALLCAVLLGWAATRIARNLPVPEYSLIALLGVWAPVFALGFFAWDVPARYTAMSLMPMTICAFAFAQRIADRIRTSAAARTARIETLGAALAAIVVVNPLAVAETVNAGYRIHPDHKGAAQFMRSIGVTEDDIVLAEDILQQTYYLGGVDYWLIGSDVARRFVMKSDKGIVDFYTGTPVVVTAEMLDQVLSAHRDKRIFIVGSGEDWENGRRVTRGELHEALESERFETLFVGRDGLTRVLRAVPSATPAAAPTSAAESEAELTRSAEEAIGAENLIEAPPMDASGAAAPALPQQ
jgi:hypothetical protein